MSPILYGIKGSPPARSVLLCAKALDVDLKIKEVDLLNLAHRKPEFLELNPQHTIPVLDDDGFILADSHAIMAYLVSKYGKEKSLYPEDLQQRAIVDQRLHFDSSTLFVRGLAISRSLMFGGATEIPQRRVDFLLEAFQIAEELLQKEWIAGDQLTIADFSFVTSLTSWSIFSPLSETLYPKLTAWLKRMESLPYYAEANQRGLDEYHGFMKDRFSKIIELISA